MAKFTLDLAANAEGLTVGIQNAQEALSNLGEEAVQTGKDTQNAFNQANNSTQQMQKSLASQFITIAKYEIQLKSLRGELKKTFDPKTFTDINKQIDQTKESIVGVTEEFDNLTKIAPTLFGQLRQNRDILAQMSSQGLDTTETFKQLSIATEELQNQVNETNERIKFLASDTRNIDGLIALSKTAAAGFELAAAGSALFGEENENVHKALLKVNAAMAILNGLNEIQEAIKKSSAARLTIELALEKLKIFFLGAETVATEELTAAQIAAANAAKILRAALITTGIGAIVVLLGLAANAMGLFDDAVVDTTDHIKELNDEMDRNQRNLKFNTDKQIAEAHRLGKTNQEIRDIEAAGRKKDIKLLESDLNSKRFLMEGAEEKARIFRNKASVEAFQKAQDDYSKAKDALIDALHNNIVATIDAETQKQDELRDIAAVNNANIIAAMKSGLSKELATIDEAHRKEIEEATQHGYDLNLIEKKFLSQRAEIIKSYTQKILAANNANRLALLDEGFDKEMKILQEQQRIELQNAKDQALNLEILQEKFEKERIALTEKFAKEGRDKADAETERQNKDRKETREKTIQSEKDFIDNMEKIRLAELDIEFESGNKSIKEAKRIAKEKLEVEIKALQDRLQFYSPQSSQYKQLQVAILQAQNQIKELGKHDNPLISALGLDNFTEDDLQNIKQVTDSIVGSLKSILDESVQAGLDQNKAEADRLDQQIEQVKNNIQKQQQLASVGRANDLDEEKAHLQRLQDAKQESLDKFRKLQKEQIIIDSATQISSLITSAANIFAATSKIPIVGVPLAVGAIAAMFAAFAVSKQRAFQAANQATFGKGGLIKGKRHNADGYGGERYVSDDGNSVKFLEDEEYVINRKSSMKYRGLLEAINNDNLKSLLKGTGVSLDPKKVEGYRKAKESFANAEIKHRIQLESEIGGKQTKEFQKVFESYVQRQEQKSQITFQDGYKIETRGNRIIRTKL